MLIASWCIGGGWAGTSHFIDLVTGVAAVFGTQILPTFDADTFKAGQDFEMALYAGLE